MNRRGKPGFKHLQLPEDRLSLGGLTCARHPQGREPEAPWSTPTRIRPPRMVLISGVNRSWAGPRVRNAQGQSNTDGRHLSADVRRSTNSTRSGCSRRPVGVRQYRMKGGHSATAAIHRQRQ